MNVWEWKKIFPRVISLGLPIGFFLGVLQANTAETSVAHLMRNFYFSFPLGLFIGAMLWVVIQWVRKGQSLLDAVLLGSSFIYLGFMKTLGWEWIPWVFFALCLVAVFLGWYLGVRPWRSETVLLFHVMGYGSSLYLFLHLKKYLSGWDTTFETVGLLFQWVFF